MGHSKFLNGLSSLLMTVSGSLELKETITGVGEAIPLSGVVSLEE